MASDIPIEVENELNQPQRLFPVSLQFYPPIFIMEDHCARPKLTKLNPSKGGIPKKSQLKIRGPVRLLKFHSNMRFDQCRES